MRPEQKYDNYCNAKEYPVKYEIKQTEVQTHIFHESAIYVERSSVSLPDVGHILVAFSETEQAMGSSNFKIFQKKDKPVQTYYYIVYVYHLEVSAV